MTGLALPAWVTVALFAAAPTASVALSSPTPWVLEGGVSRHQVRAGERITFTREAGRLWAHWPGGGAGAGGWSPRGEGPWQMAAGARTRRLTGRVRLTSAGPRLEVQASVPLEAYVAGALASEVPAGTPAAAQEALATCIRSYATRAVGAPRHAAAALCDATHCLRFATAPPDRHQLAAVRGTEGAVITWRGRPAEAVWHAACGGRRAPAQAAFGGGGAPYLAGGPDRRPNGTPWCGDAPGAAAWRVEMSREVVTASLVGAGLWPAGARLEQVRCGRSASDGPVETVRLAGAVTREVPGVAFWHALGPRLGWRGLRSLTFDVAPTSHGWVAVGRGLGHGVGLCQAGAEARARAGHGARAILAAYYPGTAVSCRRRAGAAPPW
ncbi:MAG: SpoIID/LytB domain-containing protein [Candidatus Sericytochromatia bacterium]|nr:SpoIID/LytB domain-containing protein [Candidatus Sericytochromatia bacterium]